MRTRVLRLDCAVVCRNRFMKNSFDGWRAGSPIPNNVWPTRNMFGAYSMLDVMMTAHLHRIEDIHLDTILTPENCPISPLLAACTCATKHKPAVSEQHSWEWRAAIERLTKARPRLCRRLKGTANTKQTERPPHEPDSDDEKTAAGAAIVEKLGLPAKPTPRSPMTCARIRSRPCSAPSGRATGWS